MGSDLSESAQKVQRALQALGLTLQVVELPNSTRTAAEAAEAVGSQLGQIVKSLVFRGEVSGKPVLILASGANRVNLESVTGLVGEPLGKADADYVRQQTGFAIGGVPPLGHSQALDAWIDEDLFQYTEIWAAAGTPNAVFRLAPADLLRMTGGRVVKIT
jgi:prolyl-tRNA editing enzyme YbaK/EbsC (Cys-tRNA(Pro) deacylase)